MELIFGAIVVLFLIVFGLLAMLEMDAAWAAGAALVITLVLCVVAAVVFGAPRLSPNPVDVVRTNVGVALAACLAVVAVVFYGVRRFMIARRAKSAEPEKVR